MTQAVRRALYSPELLALAVELADHPYDADAPLQGQAHSRSCGSSIALSLDPASRLGLRVTACAVGQASAAIFARHFDAHPVARLSATHNQIERWLGGAEERPDWPGMQILEPARAYPGRHGAILLPWRAALDALSKGGAGR
ncbi:iron-sulfur cluster assembly scaffold protein [Erythrobacter sp. SD-21]|uniref:iron-sulfur cluster assembly scaffold protein n=1 Tax=Erythrobacter sp. SD-21 TaxID=161528 RepID=UPI000153FA1B|nr:iron-sulfur cluster assembly scaffold protein [Erythrobacter sp. SD-21]EDL50291.1 hypothetical protein ED21_27508 [Erythrobacter sp. SD-21]